jgi:hypothetical protein
MVCGLFVCVCISIYATKIVGLGMVVKVVLIIVLYTVLYVYTFYCYVVNFCQRPINKLIRSQLGALLL